MLHFFLLCLFLLFLPFILLYYFSVVDTDVVGADEDISSGTTITPWVPDSREYNEMRLYAKADTDLLTCGGMAVESLSHQLLRITVSPCRAFSYLSSHSLLRQPWD